MQNATAKFTPCKKKIKKSTCKNILSFNIMQHQYYLHRWDMSKSVDTYNKAPMALTLAEVKECAKNREYGCVETPLMNIHLDHISLMSCTFS